MRTTSETAQRSRRRLVAGALTAGLALAGSGVTASVAAAATPRGDTSATAVPTATTVPQTTVPLDHLPNKGPKKGGDSGSTTGAKFIAARQQLETALAARVQQLAKLTTQVNGSTTLQTAHKNYLAAALATETTVIGGLASKVPGDVTWAQLDADRQVMLRDNRVFAVMTPQVYEAIEADSIAAEVTALQQVQEPELQSAVAADAGQPGYKNAEAHLNNFIADVKVAATVTANVADRVLAQRPQLWPHDEQVFVLANKALLRADLAVAHADYDASVIGLATGGYSGS